ncbi:alpha/beta fold hydrolase [Planotetraspora sp. GP83]|uniref:alpha/beta fold hydrolase n=1 Tax=Planotetraspora sp. GP83 TaxID=3156264 RepID=UPI00351565A0
MELAYERRGSGSPLVLLHGIGHHRQGWLPVLDLLAERHDVIAVDFPGFGESPPLPSGLPYNAETLGVAVEEFWTRLGLKDPHVAGNSLGGYVALDFASRGAVRTAVALSPAGFWSRAEHLYARTMLRVLRASVSATPPGAATALASSKAGKAVAMGMLVAKPSQISAQAMLAAAEALRECPGFDETLESFAWVAPPAPPKVPITIAWGEHDRLLPRRQAVRAARWAQQRVTLLPGCGHVPMSDDPALVAKVILYSTRD